MEQEESMIEISFSIPRQNLTSLVANRDARNVFTNFIGDIILKILDQYEPDPIDIPSTIYHSRAQTKNAECPICLEPLRLFSSLKILSCEHGFHASCMKEALEHRHRRCPLCRHDL